MNKASNMYPGKVLVVGIVRDVASSLSREIARLNDVLASKFREVCFYFVESDSSDNTVELLEKLKAENQNFFFDSLGNLRNEVPDRIQRLVVCRNRYVDFIRQCDSGFSMVVVVDLDIKSLQFTKRTLKRALDVTFEWDGLFANQLARYFDIYALRSKSWSTIDCFEEVEILSEQLGIPRDKARQIAIWDKMKRVPIDADPIEVQSAFGGLAIYKRWVFDKAKYSLKFSNLGFTESEHVSFNDEVLRAGGKLFIQPSLTNFRWNPHNLSSISLFRKFDTLTRSHNWRVVRRLLRFFFS